MFAYIQECALLIFIYSNIWRIKGLTIIVISPLDKTKDKEQNIHAFRVLKFLAIEVFSFKNTSFTIEH